MDIDKLTTFLYKASQSGYATDKLKDWVTEKDASTTIVYKDDNWEMHDNYFGGEPFGGRLTVFFDSKPVWIMVYYGFIEDHAQQSVKNVYTFLKSALRNAPEEFPLRGPKKYTGTNFIYENKWEGKITQYSGTEKIFDKDTLIYTAFYCGGFVDRRSG